MTPSKIVILLWVAFVVYWSLFALRTGRPAARKISWPRLTGFALLAVAGVAWKYAAISFSSRLTYLHALPFARSWVTDDVSIAVSAAGLAFACWARWHLDVNWSSIPEVKEGHRLVTSGPYRILRHPIYTGILFALIGTGLTNGILAWIAFAVLFAVFVYRVKVEEGLMEARFPRQYPAYRQHTKALVPFVW